MKIAAIVTGGIAVLGVALYKGRDIRAQLTMSGPGWDNLHPEVQRRALLVMADARRAGLDVGIFEGWRDEQRQRAVMDKGASWVGNWRNSYHPWGLAVDFVFLDRLGRWTWEPAGGKGDWYRLGAIIEAHGFAWGGRWSKFDGPHAELQIAKPSELQAQYIEPGRFLAATRATA